METSVQPAEAVSLALDIDTGTGYDAGGHTSAVRNLKSDRTVLSIFTYTYDNAGNRAAVAGAIRVTRGTEE